MHVALFDPSLDGHHVEHASYISRYCRDRGDHVTFLTASGDDPEYGLDGLARVALIHRLPFGRPRPGDSRYVRVTARWRALRQAYGWSLRERPDVLHHLFVDGSEFAWALQPLSRERTFATFGSLFGLRHSDARSLLRLRSSDCAPADTLRGEALRRALRSNRLDALFLHSLRIAQAVGQLAGAEKDRLHLVPDPAPPLNALGQDEARRQLDLPLRIPLLLFFGGLRRDKGPDLLLTAVKGVDGGFALVIAGEPVDFEPATLQLDADPRVIFRLGAVPAEEVDAYFAAADVVVLPYRRTFAGTSGVLGRAVAAGRPVVVTDVGDIGEIVRLNGLGLVVDEAPDALAAAIVQYLFGRTDLARDVRGRAERYAVANSEQVFASLVRAAYLEAAERGITCGGSGRRGSP